MKLLISEFHPAHIVEEENRDIANCNLPGTFSDDAKEYHAARIVECWNACESLTDPVRDIAEMREGFFEGVAEETRDDFVYYFIIRTPDRQECAPVVLSKRSEWAAQRIVDCLHACEKFVIPAAEINAIRNNTLQECADIAKSIDSGRGNEKEIAAAFLRMIEK